MKKALIVGKDTGIGNQVQFIPVINFLLYTGYAVFSDSKLYQDLSICKTGPFLSLYSRVYIVFGTPLSRIMKYRLMYPFARFYGYKYRIRGYHFSLMFNRAFRFDHDESEIRQNADNFGGGYHYGIVNRNHSLAICHYVKRPERAIPDKMYLSFINQFPGLIALVGDEPQNDTLQKHYQSTPGLNDLIRLVKQSSYYFGPDTGVMHLADYFGCKGIAFFGPTSAVKSGAVNIRNIQSSMLCSPCYRWGRSDCQMDEKYKCLKNFDYGF